MDLNRIYSPDDLEEKVGLMLVELDQLRDDRKNGKLRHVICAETRDNFDKINTTTIKHNGVTLVLTDYLVPRYNVQSGSKERIINVEAPSLHAFDFKNCDISYYVLQDQLKGDRRFETITVENLNQYTFTTMPEGGRDYGYTITAIRNFRSGELPWNGFKPHLVSDSKDGIDQDTQRLRSALVTMIGEIIGRIRDNKSLQDVLSRFG